MPRAQLGRFTGAMAVDFSAAARDLGVTGADVIGVLLEFENMDDDQFAITIQDTCVEQLALQLEALLDEIANKRGGLPITPELWELDPKILPGPSPEFDTPLFTKGDPDEAPRSDAQPPQTPAPAPHQET